MNGMQSAAVWLVIILSVIGANLPFVTQRLFGIWSLKSGKNLAIRLAELTGFYFLMGAVGLLWKRVQARSHPRAGSFMPLLARFF